MTNSFRKISILSLVFFLISVSGFAQNGLIPTDTRQAAPDFTFKNTRGEDVSLSDFKGKVVYMDLWGSWCKPCIKEMPKSKELRIKYLGEDVVFLYVALNEESNEKWLKANKRFEVAEPSLVSNDPVGTPFRNFYDKGEVPWYYLIDKQGRIADIKAKRPSEEGIGEEIDMLLNE